MNFSSALRSYAVQPAAWLRVSGTDAGTYLQGQFSQDLRGLTPRQAIYGLWLNAKGKIVADSFVVGGSDAEEFWICSYFTSAHRLRSHLEERIIADDVAVTDETATWISRTVVGPGGLTWLERTMPSTTLWFAGRRQIAENYEWLCPAAAAPELLVRWDELTAAPASELERARIRDGIAAVPTDAGPGDLPQEAGLDEAAVSFTKGCYLGQEVMARLHTRGRLRRRLRRVRGEGVPPALPAGLWREGRLAGELRSALPSGESRYEGLALLAADLPPSAAFSTSAGGAETLWAL